MLQLVMLAQCLLYQRAETVPVLPGMTSSSPFTCTCFFFNERAQNVYGMLSWSMMAFLISTAISRLSATALSSSRKEYHTPITHCSQEQPVESHLSHSYFGSTNKEVASMAVTHL